MYVGVSKQGCVFIGSENGDYDEIRKWLRKDDILIDATSDTLFNQVKFALESYYNGYQVTETVSFDIQGTQFQRMIWDYLMTIPYGTVMSYKDVANELGIPKSVRSVASSIARNPILVLIPCHRVLGSDGTLRGYRGGLEMKARLLNKEKTSHRDV